MLARFYKNCTLGSFVGCETILGNLLASLPKLHYFESGAYCGNTLPFLPDGGLSRVRKLQLGTLNDNDKNRLKEAKSCHRVGERVIKNSRWGACCKHWHSLRRTNESNLAYKTIHFHHFVSFQNTCKDSFVTMKRFDSHHSLVSRILCSFCHKSGKLQKEANKRHHV